VRGFATDPGVSLTLFACEWVVFVRLAFRFQIADEPKVGGRTDRKILLRIDHFAQKKSLNFFIKSIDIGSVSWYN